MFKVDDVIIYGAQGVCRITDIEEKNISGTKKTFYVLKPENDKGSTIFAPVENEHVLKKMRRLLSAEEIHSLIDAMPEADAVWITDENRRKERYRQILTEGDHRALIKMLKAIYTHKQQREAEGKRLHISDKHFFKDAEQILYNEFQYVLNLENRNDLMTYILERIEKRGQ